MASARAQEVAEILWELKKAGKVAKYTMIARRAGFSPGAAGRTMITTLNTVRRDWPHLQWWRAMPDDGLIEKDSEHAKSLEANGFALAEKEKKVTVEEFEANLMIWEEPEPPKEEVAAEAEAE